MDGELRRRLMGEEDSSEIIVNIDGWVTDGANTRWRTTNVIDATQKDAYVTVPFIEGDTNLTEGTTVESQPYRIYGRLYYDADCTQDAGVWYNNRINPSFNTSAVPFIAFETECKFAPKGYYAKLGLVRNSAIFSSNYKGELYKNDHVIFVTLK